MFLQKFIAILVLVFNFRFSNDEGEQGNQENKQIEENKNLNEDGKQSEENKKDTEKTVPYERFKEINEKLKAFEEKEKARELKELESKGEYEKALELLKKEKEQLEFDSILTKSGLPDKFKQFVKGNTKEEIETSIKTIKDTFKTEIESDKNKDLKDVLKGKQIKEGSDGSQTYRESLRSLFK